ncbi:uncharacterized protein LOC133350291 isoform X2 [Lethenteron reissneri]|uniref:uncharacterized protein LOC133350291 isoform X2 n=1 Tax=Lethenteron reissneri TaxID=7753 RepID=UPI002AB7D4E0|nr:uncharacterized protein LOC133350291 isoform X2 [Lethenteron reissneri]
MMALERLRGTRDESSGRRAMKTMFVTESPPGCAVRTAATLLCLLSLLNSSNGLPADPRNTGLQRRSVAEQQFMHDKGRVLQELGRRLWVQSVVGEVHTAMGRDANRVASHAPRSLAAAATDAAGAASSSHLLPWGRARAVDPAAAGAVGHPPMKNPASGKALAHRRALSLQETDANGPTWRHGKVAAAAVASKGVVRQHAPRVLGKGARNARSVTWR